MEKAKKDNFIGTIIRHPIFGKGKIEKIEKYVIKASFSNDPRNLPLHSIPFSCFVGHSAQYTTDSPDFMDLALDKYNRYKCKKCGIYDVKAIEDYSLLCSKCREDYICCPDCQKVVSRNSTNTVIKPEEECFKETDFFEIEEEVCSDCYRNYIYCQSCERYMHPSIVTSSPYVLDGQKICLMCARYNLRCAYCGIYISDEYAYCDEGTENTTKYLCPLCAGKHTHTCVKCGKQFVHSNLDSKIPVCLDCINSIRYQEYIRNLTKTEKGLFITFDELKKSHTVEIMTKLTPYYEKHNQPEKHYDYMLLSNLPESPYYPKSELKKYIIIPYDKNIFFPLEFDCGTLTQLKRKGFKAILNHPECVEFDPIIIEEKHVLHIWKKPYLLSAQTRDVMDFRKEWHGDELFFEGNEFGDTFQFMIVGYIGYIR